MLTACFDASGKRADSPCIVVAGFSTIASEWSAFEDKWAEALNRHQVSHFHAAPLARFAEPYNDWPKGEREDHRRALSEDLMRIIEDFALRKFGACILLSDIEQLRRQLVIQSGEEFMIEPFVYAAISAVEDFHAYAKLQGITSNLRYVFDDGDPQDALRKVFDYCGFSPPDFMPDTAQKNRKGITRDPFLGLQAADWIAYEYYLNFNRLLSGEGKDEGRWAFKKFEGLRGSIGIRNYGFLRDVALEAFDSRAERMADAVKRLRDAKDSGVAE